MISMIQRLSRRFALSCIVVACSLSAVISTPADSSAHDTALSPFHAKAMSTHNKLALHNELGLQNDWCVWTESNTCNYQVNDQPNDAKEVASARQVTIPTVANRPESAHPIRSRTSSSFETSLAAVAATACAHAGVSVEQLIEPFAMVGQESNHSVEEVAQFTRWWEKTQSDLEHQYAELVQLAEAKADAARENAQLATAADAVAGDVIQGDVVEEETVSLVPFVDIGQTLLADNHWSPLLASTPTFDRLYPLAQPSEPFFNFSVASVESSNSSEFAESTIREDLKKVAMEEPIDVEADSLRVLGRSILVTQSSPSASDTSYTETADALVGSSAMIVSIEEVYMPYDLAAREYPVSKWLPLAHRPYSIVKEMLLADVSESPASVNDDVQAEALPALDQVAQKQLALWAKQVASHAPNVQASVQPKRLSKRFASMLLGQQKAATDVAVQLARMLPVAVPPVIKPQPVAPVAPSEVGSQLLARAGVAPASKTDPDVILNQWISYLGKASKTVASVIGNPTASIAQIDNNSITSDQEAARR